MLARLFISLLFVISFHSLLLADDPSLIGHWNFDEGSGNIVHDLSLNANHGTIGDGPFAWVPGVQGTALELNGGRVNLGIPAGLSPSSGITLEAWYKPASFIGTGNEAIIDRGYSIHDDPFYQFHLGVCGDLHDYPYASAQFLFAVGVGGVYNIIETPVNFWTAGKWYHIVGAYDGSYQRLYVNGALISSHALTGSIPDYGNTMYFGGFSNLLYALPGTIDEISIYSRALSATEVIEHYSICVVPEITNCPGNLLITSFDPIQFDLDATIPDDSPISWTVAAIDPVVNEPSIDQNGELSFQLDQSEEATSISIEVIAQSSCDRSDTCLIYLESAIIPEWTIRIEKTHYTIQGMYEEVSITRETGTGAMGGFDFLIAYDPSALSFASASLGVDLGPTGCGWEYFTYRYGPSGNCGGPCPSGMLRVLVIADANNGANHPDCFSVPDGGELVRLKFYVTNDRNYECQYVPIRFAWMDCGDNGISSVGGDTLWISSQVFEFEDDELPYGEPDPDQEITDMNCYFAIAYGGACSVCDVSQKYEPIRFIVFWNGGIDIVCADSIDAPGDLNLNGVASEIADAVLYANYFIHGYSAFDVAPPRREAQIAASDVNRDGIPLTVGDLVYMLRIMLGDADPIPKLVPFANSADVSFVDGTLSTDANVELGGVYATFRIGGPYTLTANTHMELMSAEDNGLLKVLVYAGLNDPGDRIDAGRNDLFVVEGAAEFVGVEIADFDGNMMDAKIVQGILPMEFQLSQNVPNPFNPTTKIGIELPTVSDWTLSVYNVAGQLVKSVNGRGVGSIQVDLDAREWASGIYLYRVTAGQFTDTRKMLLLK